MSKEIDTYYGYDILASHPRYLWSFATKWCQDIRCMLSLIFIGLKKRYEENTITYKNLESPYILIPKMKVIKMPHDKIRGIITWDENQEEE